MRRQLLGRHHRHRRPIRKGQAEWPSVLRLLRHETHAPVEVVPYFPREAVRRNDDADGSAACGDVCGRDELCDEGLAGARWEREDQSRDGRFKRARVHPKEFKLWRPQGENRRIAERHGPSSYWWDGWWKKCPKR